MSCPSHIMRRLRVVNISPRYKVFIDKNGISKRNRRKNSDYVRNAAGKIHQILHGDNPTGVNPFVHPISKIVSVK